MGLRSEHREKSDYDSRLQQIPECRGVCLSRAVCQCTFLADGFYCAVEGENDVFKL